MLCTYELDSKSKFVSHQLKQYSLELVSALMEARKRIPFDELEVWRLSKAMSENFKDGLYLYIIRLEKSGGDFVSLSRIQTTS